MNEKKTKIQMNQSTFKTAFKTCRLKTKPRAGRNNSGQITSFHRGGGCKRLYRQIDFKRNLGIGLETNNNRVVNLRQGIKGHIQTLEYDPNRSGRIALVKWFLPSDSSSGIINTNSNDKLQTYSQNKHMLEDSVLKQKSSVDSNYSYFSYILAYDGLEIGDEIENQFDVQSNQLNSYDSLGSVDLKLKDSSISSDLSLLLKTGSNAPLSCIPIGTFLYNVEIKPGRGGQLVRSAGTYAQLIQKKEDTQNIVIRLPSGVLKQLDYQCRATIGAVSNNSHNKTKLKKAGQNRWLGKRPTVRGVAMNPIDHPHGGGEGRTKGGRPSVSPWGKPTKGGFKTSRRVVSASKSLLF